MAEAMRKPRYVEYGGRATAPGPFLCSEGRFRGLILRADHGRLKRLIDRVYNEPAGDAVSFRVPVPWVLMLIGWFGKVRATTPPWDEVGTVREVQVCVWVPVVQGREDNGHFEPERLSLVVPYIVVDNPMSYAGGRETYGFPKSLGRFDLAPGPDGQPSVDGTMSVAAYGGDFDYDNEADWNTLLTIRPSDGEGERRAQSEPAAHLEGPEQFVRHIAGGALDGDAEARLPGGLVLVKNLIKDLFEGKSHQIFLKQFRDAREPDAACYQEIIHAPITMLDSSADFFTDEWTVEINNIDSHPIACEMGLETQTTRATYTMDMSFICERGEPLTPEPVVPALESTADR
jgi:hypothetical protein